MLKQIALIVFIFSCYTEVYSQSNIYYRNYDFFSAQLLEGKKRSQVAGSEYCLNQNSSWITIYKKSGKKMVPYNYSYKKYNDSVWVSKPRYIKGWHYFDTIFIHQHRIYSKTAIYSNNKIELIKFSSLNLNHEDSIQLVSATYEFDSNADNYNNVLNKFSVSNILSNLELIKDSPNIYASFQKENNHWVLQNLQCENETSSVKMCFFKDKFSTYTPPSICWIIFQLNIDPLVLYDE